MSQLVLFDKGNNKDRCSISTKGTDVIIKNHETGEQLFRGSNKVIVSGSAFTAAKHWNLSAPVATPTYNTVLGLDNTVPDTFREPGIRREEQVYLFAVGIDGCGPENNQVFNVDYTKWISPDALVPFKYVVPTNDIPESLREKYYGRKATSERIMYYFKAFDEAPVFRQQYTDGTPIDENIYLSNRRDEVESYVEVKLSITKEDCRDFFLATTGINDARINTISLLTAYAKEIDGHVYYQNIRPLTKLNFPNEVLIDESKALDVIYHVYY